MFAFIDTDSSWKDYPQKILHTLLVSLFFLVSMCFLAVPIALRVVVGLIRWPFIAHAKGQRRLARRIEIQQEGRLISLATFDDYARSNEGLAIRDFEGCLWWTKEVPAPVRLVNSEHRQERRFVRLYELNPDSNEKIDGEEANRVTDLSSAFLVDIPKGKLQRKDWQALGRNSQIAMLSFQLKE